MIANYGYVDGSGEYYISINTDCCITCGHRGCLNACPQHIFEIITDDYDDEVAAIKSVFKNTLKYTCAPCKPTDHVPPLPCVTACTPGAIKHTW